MSAHANTPANEADGAPVRLGALEAQVMDLLWTQSPMTVRALIERIPSDPAYTTIATVLGNLRKKDLVATQKDGHTTLYAASVSREQHAARLMDHALNESGDRVSSILHFVEGMPESDQQLLRDFLLRERDGDAR